MIIDTLQADLPDMHWAVIAAHSNFTYTKSNCSYFAKGDEFSFIAYCMDRISGSSAPGKAEYFSLLPDNITFAPQFIFDQESGQMTNESYSNSTLE